MGQTVKVGSEEHKERFCRFFIDTHLPYDPKTVRWPELDEGGLARLRSLPFWDEAVSTEHETALKVQALAPIEKDPLLHEAIALQGYEEGRHCTLLQMMTRHYGIAVPARPEPELPADLEWGFLRTGYGECFDSFFAFGLFAIAKDSGFFAPALVELFDPIMQEEARHILFFVNWVSYCRARRSLWQRPGHLWLSVLGMGLQAWDRLQSACGVRANDFTLKGHESIDTSISARGFIEICLRENKRRLEPYDEHLPRPRLVPTIARTLCWFLR